MAWAMAWASSSPSPSEFIAQGLIVQRVGPANGMNCVVR